jgi:hypothetical protein
MRWDAAKSAIAISSKLQARCRRRNSLGFSTSSSGRQSSSAGTTSIHYTFMDWRHLPELLNAARPLYAEWKNLLVWNKTNAGQGSFYRLSSTLHSGSAICRSSLAGRLLQAKRRSAVAASAHPLQQVT